MIFLLTFVFGVAASDLTGLTHARAKSSALPECAAICTDCRLPELDYENVKARMNVERAQGRFREASEMLGESCIWVI